MPYSITTKDGITINNIPDDVDPNSDALKQRVSEIRGSQDVVDDSGIASGNVSEPVLGDPAAEEAMRSAANLLSKTDPSYKPGAIKGAQEAAASIVSGAVAEPIAGMAGVVQSLNPFAAEGAGAKAVEATRGVLTFTPKTEQGEAALGSVSEALKPVSEAVSETENFLGDLAFDITGSPAIAAAAKTLPTAVLEAIGGKSALAKSGGKLRRTGSSAPLKVTEPQVSRALVEAAPDIETLKNASRSVYKEIDDIGAMVKPEAASSLMKTIIRRAKKERANPVLTPKSAEVAKVLERENKSRRLRSVTELDDIRKIVQNAASSLDPSDARVGALMLDEIDSFMDNVGAGAFVGDGAQSAAGVGSKYRAARKLWGRARRAELIQDAMAKAQNQASGFENGIRTQLRAIVNNKKRARFFSKDELAAMSDVIQGSTEQNVLKLVGRLGFSEGQATNILGGLAGTAMFGPVAPVVGQASRAMAQRSTRKAAALSDAVVKAGPNGRAIAKAYLQATPKASRKPSELSRLLIDGGADIDKLIETSSGLLKEAAEVAKGRLAFGAGAIAAGSAKPEGEE